MRMVVVEVQGGVVQAIHGSPGIVAVVVDWDTDGVDGSEPCLVTVHDEDGEEVQAFAGRWETSPMSDMAVETAEAVRKAL
jgi:hypothetical protein